MSKPTASIVITNFNYSRYLAECLVSCQQQETKHKYEIIVVDDGSTDDSVSLVKSRLDHRTRLVRIENSGIEVAANTGFANAQGDFVVRVDSDDLLGRDYLTAAIDVLMQSPNIGFVYSDYWVIDAEGYRLYQEQLPPFDRSEIVGRGDFLATGTLYRAALLRQLGGYSTAVKNCGLENYRLILQLLKDGVAGLRIAGPRFSYRRHALNVSVQRKDAIIRYGKAMFEEFALGSYGTNAYHPYKLKLQDA